MPSALSVGQRSRDPHPSRDEHALQVAEVVQRAAVDQQQVGRRPGAIRRCWCSSGGPRPARRRRPGPAGTQAGAISSSELLGVLHRPGPGRRGRSRRRPARRGPGTGATPDSRAGLGSMRRVGTATTDPARVSTRASGRGGVERLSGPSPSTRWSAPWRPRRRARPAPTPRACAGAARSGRPGWSGQVGPTRSSRATLITAAPLAAEPADRPAAPWRAVHWPGCCWRGRRGPGRVAAGTVNLPGGQQPWRRRSGGRRGLGQGGEPLGRPAEVAHGRHPPARTWAAGWKPRWTWASTIPGSRVALDPSTTTARAGRTTSAVRPTRRSGRPRRRPSGRAPPGRRRRRARRPDDGDG